MISQEDIFQISSKKEFEKITLKVFRHQYDNNLVYQQFCNFLKKDKTNVKSLTEIPFLPIQFFKSHNVLSSPETIQQTFTSSGTTGMQTSKHLVTDVSWYEMSYRLGFSEFYGNIEDYCVLALLPSYLEREGSSLIYMVEDLIQSSNHEDSGFYLNNYDELISKLIELDDSGQNVILIGVTYALLDLIEKQKFQLKNTIIDKSIVATMVPLRDPELNESRASKIFGLFRDRIRALSPDEFQNLLRPAFREDEMTLIVLGGLTGFLAGWLHLVLVFFPAMQ